jgi:hypothetical protein
MQVNEEAVSFASFSIVKIVAAELLRRGVLDRLEFLSAISLEIDRLSEIGTTRNEDAATLLTAYRNEL